MNFWYKIIILPSHFYLLALHIPLSLNTPFWHLPALWIFSLPSKPIFQLHLYIIIPHVHIPEMRLQITFFTSKVTTGLIITQRPLQKTVRLCYQRICVTSWQQRSRTHRPESCTMVSIEILSSYLQTIMHSRSSRETGGTMVGGLDQRHSVWQNHTQARTQAKPCNTCQWLDSSQESCSSNWLAMTTSYLVRFSCFEEGCRAVQRWLRRCPPSPWE